MHLQSGRLDAAFDGFSALLLVNPQDAAGYSNLGLVLRARKQEVQAVQAYDRALALQPDFAQAWANRGNVLRDMARHKEAEQSYRKALAIQPNFASAWHGLGLALGDLKQWQDALAAFDAAIAHKPEFAVAYLDRGNALRELDRPEEALTSYDRALQSNDNYAQAWSNRGVVLKQLGRMDDALQSYDRALTCKPDFVDAMVNCSTLLKEMLQLDASMQLTQRALALDANSSGAHLNLAICYLLKGDFPNGFQHFEWRWKTDQLRDGARKFTQPIWLGQELPLGSTVLLHAEQGLGDTLQFCRYAQIVAQRGLRVVLEVQAPLVELMRGVRGVSEVFVRGGTLPAFDAHCPLMSLPLASETTVQTIPAWPRYLQADAERRDSWKSRLGATERKRVGLVWSGRPEHKNDHNRSIALDVFAQMLDARFEYHCLQKEIRPADQERLFVHPEISMWSDQLQSFSDTAALVECLDLVIAVDTSVAHLAAALGKPVWLLLPFSPDWRWLLDRQDTPWYPGMRLFRQAATGDWSSALLPVRSALAAFSI